MLAAAVLVVLGSATALAQSSDPLIGTWKLNVAKSKGISFKSGTSKIEAAGAGVKFTVDLVSADGTPDHWTFTANYDGKDNPVSRLLSPGGETPTRPRADRASQRAQTECLAAIRRSRHKRMCAGQMGTSRLTGPPWDRSGRMTAGNPQDVDCESSTDVLPSAL